MDRPQTRAPISASARASFLELFEQFRSQIGLEDLQLDSELSCTIAMGSDEARLDITLELTSEQEVLLYAALDYLPSGLTPELVLLIDTVNANRESMFYLSASKHYLFLCSASPIGEVTATRLIEWVKWFYEQAIEWRGKYRTLLPTQAAPVRGTGSLKV